MKKVLALALLCSVTFGNMRAMDPRTETMKKVAQVCMPVAACMLAQKMVTQEGYPVMRTAADANTVSDLANKLVDGSVQAVYQRALSPLASFGVNYSNDLNSVAQDALVNAAVLELDSKLQLSSLNSKLQSVVNTSLGKFVYVALLNAVVKTAYAYVVNQFPSSGAAVVVVNK